MSKGCRLYSSALEDIRFFRKMAHILGFVFLVGALAVPVSEGGIDLNSLSFLLFSGLTLMSLTWFFLCGFASRVLKREEEKDL